ncbi:excalibur calcium-binding domain-containing protein [Micromonospora parva]|uniref:excalibur calcium-binding domain-containing protein n=1 Tax=Micromonospora parva TaxID=1464048 RepID=UPI00365E8A72
MHQQAQAVARSGHPLRQDRHHLPRRTPPRRHLHLVGKVIRRKRPRGVRRWWARRGAWVRGVIIAGALLVALFVVAGIQGSGERGRDGPGPSPSGSATETASRDTTVPPTATATIPVPVRPEPVDPAPQPTPSTTEPAPEETTTESVRFENCDEARAAGAAPLLLGEPGYRLELDRNKDGVACEDD